MTYLCGVFNWQVERNEESFSEKTLGRQETCLRISIQLNRIWMEIERNWMQFEWKLNENWTTKDRISSACQPVLMGALNRSIIIRPPFPINSIQFQVPFNYKWILNRIEKSRWVDPLINYNKVLVSTYLQNLFMYSVRISLYLLHIIHINYTKN